MLKDDPLLSPIKRTGMASMDCPSALEDYTSSLVDTMFPGKTPGQVFSYSSPAPLASPHSLYSNKEFAHRTPSRSQRRKKRVISSVPERILDAPDFVDDYYLNLLDWSSDNILAVALARTVFLWDGSTENITELPVSKPNLLLVCDT